MTLRELMESFHANLAQVDIPDIAKQDMLEGVLMATYDVVTHHNLPDMPGDAGMPNAHLPVFTWSMEGSMFA